MNTNVVGVVPRIGRQLLGVAIGVCAVVATAQAQRTLTGRVTDAGTHAPVPGVAVLVTGTQLGATTTDSGTFRINGVAATAVTLTARRIGYQPATAPVAADQDEVTIAMTQDVLQLEAQVITGAATTISSQNSPNDSHGGQHGSDQPGAGADDRERPAGEDPGRARSSRTTAARRVAACRSRSAASRRSTPDAYAALRDRRRHGRQRDDQHRRERDHRRRQQRHHAGPAGQQPEPHRRHQPERHRVDSGAEGRLGLRDLRIAGGAPAWS